MILDTALNHGPVSQPAGSFADYLPPTPEVKDILFDYAKSRGVDSMAYVYLFQIGLFDEEVRSEFVKGLDPSKPFEIRRDYALTSIEMGLEEALPTYIEMLEQPSDLSAISFVGGVPADTDKAGVADYKLAADGIRWLGEKGKEALPLLKERIAEIREAFPDPEQHRYLTGTLIGAVNSIESPNRRPVKAAMSGRGALDLDVGPKPIPLPSGGDVDNLEEAVTAPPAPLEDSSPAAAQEAVVSDPDKSEAERR